jgi:NADPH-dependent curcumin reductase CurA
MTHIMSREIHLVSRPKGMPTAENFALVKTELEALGDQQSLVRNLYLSVDPYMRGRMNDEKSYVPSFELGKAMDGGAVGEVISEGMRQESNGEIRSTNISPAAIARAIAYAIEQPMDIDVNEIIICPTHQT